MVPLTLLLLSAFVGAVVGHQCPRDWIYHAGSCYGYGRSTITWADAQVTCELSGGSLAVIDSADENDFLVNLARNNRAFNVWLGGSNMFMEGVWIWNRLDQLINGYTNWAPGQPNNYNNGEHCLGLYVRVDYKWNDSPCHGTGTFICEATPTKIIVEEAGVQDNEVDQAGVQGNEVDQAGVHGTAVTPNVVPV